MTKSRLMYPYSMLLLALAISLPSSFPLTRAQGLVCQIRINNIDAPTNVSPGEKVTVSGHLLISCSPSQLSLVVRIDLTDNATAKLLSSSSISLGFVGPAARNFTETSSNAATAPSVMGPWKLTLKATLYGATQTIASAAENLAIQVGQTITQPATATSITSLKNTSTTPQSAGGGLEPSVLYAFGAVVAVAVVASVLALSRRKKGASTPQPSKPAESKVVLEPRAPEPEPVVTATAQPRPVASPTISTGYTELDEVLAGGLPVGYAILTISPPCDEKDLLIRRIMDRSLAIGKPVFFLSRDLARCQDLARGYRENFFAFHPQADKIVSEHPNILKISGVENLSDLNISLTKSAETLLRLFPSKVLILDILSDVLLHHKALTTRKWLDAFISKRKAEGFTVIATLNPLITSATESQSLVDLFDGIIEIYERELRERARRFLIVKKMYGKKYQETELMLDKDKLF